MMNNHSSTFGKNIGRVAIGTVVILLIPMVAMRISNQVDWSVSDFIVAGLLLFGTGVVYVLLTARTRSTKRRVIVGGVLLVLLGAIWVQLAAGIFG